MSKPRDRHIIGLYDLMCDLAEEYDAPRALLAKTDEGPEIRLGFDRSWDDSE